MTDIGQTFTSSAYVRHIIREGDPLSSRTETDYRVTLKRKDTEVTHHSRGTLTCDADYFYVVIDMEVFERGRSVFKRRWDEKIKRGLHVSAVRRHPQGEVGGGVADIGDAGVGLLSLERYLRRRQAQRAGAS